MSSESRAVLLRRLNGNIEELRADLPGTSRDQIFVHWILLTKLTDSPVRARESLNPPGKEKSADAIFLDDKNRVVIFVQGKCHTGLAIINEPRKDVLNLVHICKAIQAPQAEFEHFLEGVGGPARHRYRLAREAVKIKHYRMRFLFATTGRIAKRVIDEAKRELQASSENAELLTVTSSELLSLLDDYDADATPAIPDVDLPFERRSKARNRGPFHRWASPGGPETWVFSMDGDSIAHVYRKAGNRLFARNVRGYLGDDTGVNEKILETIRLRPGQFWYLNNGVTIISTEAKPDETRDCLHVTNPQVINGLQTVRALAKKERKSSKASVLVRVIVLPKSAVYGLKLEQLIQSIVGATNLQNKVTPLDLHTNDRVQVKLGRSLWRAGYSYVRKREASDEESVDSFEGYEEVNMEELAYSSAVCDYSSNLPVTPKVGKAGLFRREWYGRVFPNSDANHYLPRYWTTEVVRSSIREFTIKEARWLTIHFLWNALRDAGVLDYALAYSQVCREGLDGTPRLAKAYRRLKSSAKIVIQAAERYYHLNYKQNGKVLSPAAFFKQDGHDEKFRDFFRFESVNAKRRLQLERNLARLQSGVRRLAVV